VQGLRTRTEQIADELLDSLAARADTQPGADPVDLVETYCALLPVTVIAEILGVPETDRGKVLEFGTGAAPSLDLGLTWPEFRSVEDALSRFEDWLTDHIELKRRQPGDDLLSKLVAARDDDGTALTDAELRATAMLVLAAGFETTVNLLGNGIALLHDNPDQLALLRREPERWSTAVEEVLRLDPPVLLTGRTAVRDTEIAGVRVQRGAVVTALLAGANRDPDVFADPGTFDVTRANASEHVAFSGGRHFCLGAALARMEGEVGLRRLFDRYPDLRLEPGARRRSTRILRGFATLPASLS
jgi:cytochrome P450